ncbi:DUF4202 domain-containing protein [uncultured Porticoccus sp.]|uniref:DUF4202 domain-containing protein n=1 Tax=uncultured Porticoccus sp. TaxID=1256050 RepID=UPI0030DA4931|tara:strand:+ start:3753 stop:4400 length:648 start_codon:yes stop_codon:yes gene_type:complete
MKKPDTNIIDYPVTPATDSSLARLLAAIDHANSADPRRETLDGESLPKELAYSIRMSQWLFRLEEQPSELAQIACRAQHIERWTIPRDEYPEGRSGYYRWRQACGRFHGERTAELMTENGYNEQDCAAIKSTLSKKQIKQDAVTQLMENAACLVFLQRYLEPFYQEHTDYDLEKWIRIITRTWDKMSESGHKQALAMLDELPKHLQVLLKKALIN